MSGPEGVWSAVTVTWWYVPLAAVLQRCLNGVQSGVSVLVSSGPGGRSAHRRSGTPQSRPVSPAVWGV